MNKKKILIIDDDNSLNATLKASLEKTGKYEVKTEDKGTEGLATAKTYRPDLILLDIMMPDMDGGELGAQIKTDDSTKDIPLIFLTAAVTKEELKKEGNIIGGHPFIAKPIKIEELITYIDKYVR